MILRRSHKRNLFVDQKLARRKRFRRLGMLAAVVAAILFFSVGGVKTPVQSEIAPMPDAELRMEAKKDSPKAVLVSHANTGETRLSLATGGRQGEAAQGGVDAAGSMGPPPPPEPEIEVAEGRIESGQTASSLLAEMLSTREIYEADMACRDVYALSLLRAGRPYRLETRDGDFERFVYEIDDESLLVLKRDGEGFIAETEAIEYDLETVIVHGEINSSLFEAVDEIGEHPSLAVRLSEIFAWDIDFVRAIRQGDCFRAVVQKRYRDGEFAGYGMIPAAMFVNQGQEFKGFLYADADGRSAYYDENGHSLRKAFLKAPLSFTRISSGYSLSRLHPILKVRRPHQGIDYAAPKGTPVKAVGDGVVLNAGWDRGGGRFVKIRHNSVYESTYMHLAGFAKNVKSGKRVSQGQVIGYVGSSGLSTGPHLDFRMKKNGSYVNPSRIKSPPCEPVPANKMKEFHASIAQARARLEAVNLMHAGIDGDAETAVQ